MRRLPTVAAAALVLAGIEAAAAGPSFKTTWRATDTSGVSFQGKKVAALVITRDDNLRISSEEQLAREITARGVNGVATYRMAPKEELVSAERAKPWFERGGVEGVVALRPTKYTDTVYTPRVWTESSYSTLWGYYGYGWGSTTLPGDWSEDTTIVVETLVFSVPQNKLLWAGVSSTTNPKAQPQFIKQLVDAAVKEMRKQKLVK